MANLHEFYDQLTDLERGFVDEKFRHIMQSAKVWSLPLDGNDTAEVAVDAVSRWIIQSRRTTPA